MAGKVNPIELDVDLNIKNGGEKTVGELRKEFKDLNKAIGETVQGTDEYYKILNKLAQVKGDLKDLKEDIRGLDPQDRFKAIQGSVTGLAGGLVAAQGAVALFAGENEDLQKVLVKVQAAMSVLSGLQAFNDGIRQSKVLIGSLSTLVSVQKATTVATQAQTVATEAAATAETEAAVATTAWGTALKAIGIGVLLSLIPLVATAFDGVKKSIEDTSEAQKQLNEVNLQAAKDAVSQRVQLDILFKSASNVNLSVKDRLVKVRELQDAFPGYFDDIKTEKDLNNSLSDAYNNATQGIIAKAKAEAIYNKIVENQNKILELQNGIEKDNTLLKEAGADADKGYILTVKEGISNLKKQITEIEGINQRLEGSIPKGKTTDDVKAEQAIRKEQEQAEKTANQKAIAERKRVEDEFSKITNDQNKKQFDANEQALVDLENARKKVLEIRKATQLSPDEEAKYKNAWDLVLGRIDEEDRKRIIENIKKQQERTLNESAAALNKEQAQLAKQLADKQISQKEFNDLSLSNQIKFDEQLLASDQVTADKKAEIQNRLNENLSKQNEIYFNDTLEKIKDQQTLAFEELNKEVADHEISNEEAEVLRKQQITNDLQTELDLRKAYGENTIQLESELSNARIELVKAETEFRKAQLNEIGDTLNNLTDVIGKNTAAGKALAIAKALIDTYSGVTQIIGQESTLPSPFDWIAKGVNIAAALGAGYKAVKAITSVKVPGKGGGVGGAQTASSLSSITGGSIPSAVNLGAQTQTTQLSASSINLLNQQGQTVPVRAYILESDIRNSTGRINNFNTNNSLGGTTP